MKLFKSNLFLFIIKMYAVVQEIDGYLGVCGINHRLYTDLEEATKLYSDTTTSYFLECLQYPEISSNTPQLMDLQTGKIIYPSKNVINDIKDIYNNWIIESSKNDDEQYNKAKSLKNKLIDDIRAKILSN
jgi:hypothetical protein